MSFAIVIELDQPGKLTVTRTIATNYSIPFGNPAICLQVRKYLDKELDKESKFHCTNFEIVGWEQERPISSQSQHTEHPRWDVFTRRAEIGRSCSHPTKYSYEFYDRQIRTPQ